MFVDEQHIMLKTGVEMRLKAQLDNHRIVMAVYVSIDSIEPLEKLAN